MSLGISRWAAVAVLSLGLGLAGCASNPADPNDPLEAKNRDVDAINNHLDRTILAPVVTVYIDAVPSGMRQGVSNFFDNLEEPNNMLNDLLQGKVGDAFTDAGRFVVNTTIGVGGLFDAATSMGMERNDEDFGQTLGVWGTDEGAYLVLPLHGPSSVRDVFQYPVAYVTHPFTYIDIGWVGVPLTALSVLDTRARLDSAIRLRDASALDSYIFTREAYRQRRIDKIYDGNPPDDAFDNLDKASSDAFNVRDIRGATASN
jgi:phospholipid-binding lipoprotein MlaA